jgi:hypothetical protein
VNAILRAGERAGDAIKFKIDLIYGMSYLEVKQAGGQAIKILSLASKQIFLFLTRATSTIFEYFN